MTIIKRGSEWLVLSKSTGKVLGRHSNRQRALSQLAAVEISKSRKVQRTMRRRPREHFRRVRTKRGRKRITVNRGVRGRPRDVRRKIFATYPDVKSQIQELLTEDRKLALKVRKGAKHIIAGEELLSAAERRYVKAVGPRLTGVFSPQKRFIGLPRLNKINRQLLTHEATHAAIDAKLRDALKGGDVKAGASAFQTQAAGLRPETPWLKDEMRLINLAEDAEIRLQSNSEEERKRGKRELDSNLPVQEYRERLHKNLQHSKKLRDLPDVFVPEEELPE